MSSSAESEATIAGLREDCFRMQEEVQKALKIHKANKQLQDKNIALKAELERVVQQNAELQAQVDNLCSE